MIMFIGLFGHVMMALIHALIVVMDVTLFFVLARYVAIVWHIPLFQQIDRVGSPLIDPLMSAMGRMGVPGRAHLLVLSLSLMVGRISLVAVAHSMIVRS